MSYCNKSFSNSSLMIYISNNYITSSKCLIIKASSQLIIKI